MLASGTILAAFAARIERDSGRARNITRMAKTLDADRALVYQWYKGRAISPRYAVKIGVFCGFDPRYLAACAAHERAEDDYERATWEAIANALDPGQAAIDRFLAGSPGRAVFHPTPRLATPRIAPAPFAIY